MKLGEAGTAGDRALRGGGVWMSSSFNWALLRDEPLEPIDTAAANEADRGEQARVVELNEDDYR